MKSKEIFSKLAKALLVSFLLFPAAAFSIEKPNILIFYVDDLGWQDTELNDLDAPCPYETPNIVKLAEAGMNFTQAHAPATCCSPSRAAIITGWHPAKNGMTNVSLGSTKTGPPSDKYSAPYLDKHLDTDLLTLADVLNNNGYRTGHTGKWHIGLTAASYGFGFVDQTRGFHRKMADRTKDFATVDDKKYPLSKEKYPPYSAKNPEGISYPFDQLTESSIQFMEDNKEEPFFLNMCHWMVHWPVMTRNAALLEYYCDKMGQPFPPVPGDRLLPGQQNPYFAAMVTSVDWSLGRVLDYLKVTDDPRHPGKKLIETTYIFFSSDNGGAEQRGKEIISDNYPLKYGKTHAEQGGVRVPTIISGPGVPTASQFDGLINQLDFFPTIVDLTSAPLAAEDRKELSGLDISPVIFGESDKVMDEQGKERTFLFWHYPHSSDHMKSGIREGDYTFYIDYPQEKRELYRLYKDGERYDLEEEKNLIDNPKYASIAARLSANLEMSLKANNARGPYLNPTYNKRIIEPVSVASTTFSKDNRQVHLRLENATVKEAYVIYVGESKNPNTQFGVKFPATISNDGNVVSAYIPKDVPSYRFVLIDANDYQVYSDVESVL